MNFHEHADLEATDRPLHERTIYIMIGRMFEQASVLPLWVLMSLHGSKQKLLVVHGRGTVSLIRSLAARTMCTSSKVSCAWATA